MKDALRFAVPLALLLGLVAVVTAPAPRADQAAKHYVCAPCGLPCYATVFDHPGTCPQCGVALVEQGSAAAAPQPGRKVGILIFNGVEIIDYTGPWEVFGAAGFDVYTVAATRDPITTAMGMKVVPRYTFDDAPRPEVLVVPGGGVKMAREDAATQAWVKSTAAAAPHTMSVCKGAFILASAGLLDGLGATTTASNLDKLKAEFPKIRVVYDQRFVDNGKIVTTGGLSAGIDGALHLVDKILGHGNAQQVALSEEYDWQPQSGFAAGALAERIVPELHEEDLHTSGDWKVLSTEGDRERWDVALQGPTALSPGELQDKLEDLLATRAKWTRLAAATGSRGAPSRWKTQDRDGGEWSGSMSVAAASQGSRDCVVKIHVERAH